MKWKIRLNNVCKVCDETYVKPLWKVLGNICKTKATFKQILGLDELFDHYV